MIRLTSLGVLCLILLGVLSCASEPVSKEATNNPDVPVAVLFDYDGCRVYRFRDAGQWIYFAKCGTSVQAFWNETHTSDKRTYTVPRQVLTEQNR